MTGQRSRLARLEVKTRPPADTARCFEADAGVWRELATGKSGAALSLEEQHLADGAGGALLRLPGGKYIVGIDGAAL